MNFFNVLGKIYSESGFAFMNWQNLVMLLISFALLYLAIVKKFEPLLLLPIAFGIFLANLPMADSAKLMNEVKPWFADPTYRTGTGVTLDQAVELMRSAPHWYESGVLKIIHYGVKSTVFPCLMFLCVGSMTDFGPLIANPISLLLGAAAQFGIYIAFTLAGMANTLTGGLISYTAGEAASIGIIGGADGPTAIFISSKLAPELTSAIAIAAYSYMALIPMIQPFFMRLLTTKKEREIKMTQLRKVSKVEKIVFPIFVALLCSLMLPSVAPLLGMLMLGNLLRESGVTGRLSDTAQNALCNIITICLGLTVGATADGTVFLVPKTLGIVALGLMAFCFSTIGGLLLGKLLCFITGGKINPLIGSAGVSAVPMAARVSQVEGAKANPSNFLLMHAMGPNVAGVIGSAVAAGFFLAVFK